MFKTPPYLKKGDLVVLLTPAGFIEDDKSLVIAEKLLDSWGLKSTRGKYLLEKNGHFSGTDKQRLYDLQKGLDDPKIKAIWAVRGGYGTTRIISKLNFSKFKKYPKWVIGFSDITVMHSALHLLNFKSIHGIMPIQLLEGNEETKSAVESLRKGLFGEYLENVVPASKFNKVGSSKGILTGGNLSLLQSLLGSPFQINPKGKMLFLEEIGEELYRIDRLLQSLKLAGYFDDLKGLIIGGFTAIKEDKVAYDKTYQELILEAVANYDFPVLFDIPSGHIPNNHALILGSEVMLNVGEFVSCVRTQ